MPPSGTLDVQGQLGSAWPACRWMFSTTAVLNPCQARNDSGSLTPSFTGLVTRVRRLMAVMGLEELHPRPRTTNPAAGAKAYPYLLRDRVLTRADEVWSSD